MKMATSNTLYRVFDSAVTVYLSPAKDPLLPSEKNFVWVQDTVHGTIQIDGKRDAGNFSQNGVFYGVVVVSEFPKPYLDYRDSDQQ